MLVQGFSSSYYKLALVNNYKHTWNKWKRRKSQQTNGTYKEEPNGKFRTEWYKTKMKNSMGELNSRIKRTEERISESEDRRIEITQTELQRKSRLK